MWAPYKKRLARDLDRWEANGWVTNDGRTAILSDVESSGRNFSLASALAILASVLFGFAAISFVAAHWEEMPRLGRLVLLLASIWAGYGVAGWLAARGHGALADAAILFAVAMFGASIMLISQMYNIDGNPPDAVLMWWIGALFAGVLLRSNPALALAMVLVCVWSSMEVLQSNAVHWPFLGGWAAVTGAFVWQRWFPGLHLSALALTGFLISLGYLLGRGHEHTAVAIIGMLVAAAVIGAEKVLPDYDHLTAPILAYAVVVTFAGLYALQFFENTSLGTLIALAALTLVLLLGAISYGLATANRGVLWLGYIGFSLEVLSVYWKTVGSILNTSLFFLVAALIVAALAYMALRIAQRGRSSTEAAV
ncbi:hypothetical protein HYPDE_29423 [Hyphomicrobium denitrificans 1NES1]|uniref:DUF2157 domain-containing protein n=1 Tax=Hyphomicrobium denitrificans 1NES1 TaxID=670307 RepID=N0BBR7_9HYPH|nr:DUF2157 domain-containing protein [Hyphomicrobium denitrificans]AGK57560.1 hypothetical protein HYPDE_29423 [Hyphomicrobium denitrificans 1NES1]